MNFQRFAYQQKEVRVIDVNGEPWVAAKDVCEILGYKESSMANLHTLFDPIPDDWKGHKPIMTPGGIQQTWCLSEQGLYFFLSRSDKPAALPFQKWIAGEVVPSIRKTGQYTAPGADDDVDPDAYIIARGYDAAMKKIKRLEGAIEAQRPKVEFFDAVAGSKDAIEMSAAAKILGYRSIGRNRLFEILRQKNVLRENNEPYQEYIDRGWFRVVEQKFQKPDSSVYINIKTLVYQKGLAEIRKLVESGIPAKNPKVLDMRRGGAGAQVPQ